MRRELRDELPPISEQDYAEFSAFLKSASGINLGDNKQYLVVTRVRKIMLENNMTTLAQLTGRINQVSERALRQHVVDAMTTNETYWFRDTYPFEYLAKTLIPEYSQVVNGNKIKIWCAACSSGQEPYSVSMIFDEVLRTRFVNRLADADILATDVSTVILESARHALYDRISLARGLSAERANQFFTQVGDDTWRVNDKIRERVRFRPLNLQDSYYLLGKFDVVFCRNVLIYFSAELKLEILKKIHGVLNPGGMLFLGSSESITGLGDYFEMVHCNPGVAYRTKLQKSGF